MVTEGRSDGSWRVEPGSHTVRVSGPRLWAAADGTFSLRARDARSLLDALRQIPRRPSEANTGSPRYVLEPYPHDRITFQRSIVPFSRASPAEAVPVPLASVPEVLRLLEAHLTAADDEDVPAHDADAREWVLLTLRRLGHLFDDGSVMLAESALIANCRTMGMPPQRAGDVSAAVEQLLEAGRITRVRGSRDANGRPHHPARRGEAGMDLLRYAPAEEVTETHSSPTGETRNGSEHWVAGFVRRLPDGRQASAESTARHQEAIRAAEVVDRPLPPGFTYVQPHRRHGKA